MPELSTTAPPPARPPGPAPAAQALGRRLRLVVVSPFDPAPPPSQEAGSAHVGGVERVLGRLAQELASRGHAVTLLCSSAAASGESWEDGVRVVRVPRWGTLFRAPLARLEAHVPRDAELLHVPATYPLTTDALMRLGHRRGIPVVLDFHFEPRPSGLAGRAAAAAYRALGTRGYRHARAVLVRSLDYARSCPSLRRTAAERWRVVPNGVDTDMFRPSPRGSPDPAGNTPVLFVGRLVRYKGLDVLLHALARLDPAPPLVVAGDGPLRRRLEGLAGSLGVRATFLGRVGDAALPGLYRSARLTVLPSVNGQEAFGITLLESMACGTPVVASRLPGVANVAAQGGLVAEPGDAASLARALRRALDGAGLPRGEALAAEVRARYAWPVVADRVLACYGEVLGSQLRQGQAEVMGAARARGHPLL